MATYIEYLEDPTNFPNQFRVTLKRMEKLNICNLSLSEAAHLRNILRVCLSSAANARKMVARGEVELTNADIIVVDEAIHMWMSQLYGIHWDYYNSLPNDRTFTEDLPFVREQAHQLCINNPITPDRIPEWPEGIS